ncbi:unnamed protein product [Alternaria burnsii]|nr:unnamed protein product [Alternaria burnsii]
MTDSEEVLDLYDIAVLLNYERITTEPRFRHTRLREVAFPDTEPRTVALNNLVTQGWNKNACTWIILDQQQASTPNAPDLPTDFLLQDQIEDSTLSNEQLETLFYQARNHDGCYQAISLLQIFFALFHDKTKLRVRHFPYGKGPGSSYMTTISRRVVVGETFRNPKLTTAIYVLPEGFSPHDSETVQSFLDLSSMQFGDVGRGPGPKGKQLFALDTPEEFAVRFSKLAKGANSSKSQRTLAISGTPVDDWLEQVALRTKERWDKRAKEKWCGHCGAPCAKSKCAGCGNAYYCGKEHQKMAWGFHKGYCSKS